MYDPQPISDQPVGLGFPHRAKSFRPGGSLFSSPGCRSCKGNEGFLSRGWKPILPGVCWFYVRSPANQRPGSGASHRVGQFRPGGSPFSSPGCRSCKCMEVFLIWGWKLSSPGCAGSMYDPQHISDRPVGLGFPHRAGRFDPEDHRFYSQDVGVVDVWRDF